MTEHQQAKANVCAMFEQAARELRDTVCRVHGVDLSAVQIVGTIEDVLDEDLSCEITAIVDGGSGNYFARLGSVHAWSKQREEEEAMPRPEAYPFATDYGDDETDFGTITE